MKGYFQFNFLISLWPIFALSCDFSSPWVRTSDGGIKGYYKKSGDGREYAAFESIPYAEPPVGKLRFEPPVPVKPWINDIDARTLPPLCVQHDSSVKQSVGEENCLYLNIYVPNIKTTKLPVIFWIHGGGFQYGTGSDQGPKYLMDRDLILVTINYRLGPLGFLSTGDDVVPGNMGLKDQAVALKWVSKNIVYFGGNPEKITLMGVSAGGASVHYHYLSHQTRGLYRNGVSFSGSALEVWAFIADATNTTKSFASSLKCPENNSTDMIQCLKNLPIDSIMNATSQLSANLYFPIAPFPPVMEKTTQNYFINDTPRNILHKGNINDVPWITGVVKDDGIFMTGGFVFNKTLMEYTDKNWETIGPLLMVLKNEFSPEQQRVIANKSRLHYFGDNRPFSTDLASVKTLTSLVGDALIVVRIIEAAKLQAKVNKSPVRFHYYTYRAAQSLSNFFTRSTTDIGVCHGDDVYLVIENININPTNTLEDKAMLHDMLNYWYSIANDETPNIGTPWPQLNPDNEELQYMHIAGPKNFTMNSNKNLGQIQFWNEFGL